jgi:hypothetical protein
MSNDRKRENRTEKQGNNRQKYGRNERKRVFAGDFQMQKSNLKIRF